MGKQCWYKVEDKWIAGVVIGQTTVGRFFKKKMYLVEVDRQSCFPPFGKWTERELMNAKDIIFYYEQNTREL